MKGISVCHYSYHRTWSSESWTCETLARAVRDLDVGAVDFHIRFLGLPEEAPAKIKAALGKTGLKLSGLSISNDFNQTDQGAFKNQVDAVLAWLRVAAKAAAPVSRIFGGHLADRSDPAVLKAALGRVVDALGIVVKEAEKLGVVLALENHGGLPCLAEEQVQVIQKISSPNLRATIDVGNYMCCGQEAHAGAKAAAPHAAYVHVKDMKKTPSSETPWGWNIKPCTIGKGDVDHLQCLRELKAAGYEGYLAVEYEGAEDEKIGVPESVRFIKGILEKL